MRKLLNILLPIIILLLCNCDDANQPVTLPSYINFGNATLLTDEIGEGSKKLPEIVDIWMNVNNVNYGVIPSPKNFPVLENGENWLLTRAGIKNNNQTGNRVAYPFYQLDSMQVNLVAGDTLNINPQFKYRDDLNFKLISNFDNSNDFELFLGDGIMQTTANAAEVFEGNKSLKLSLNEDNLEFGIFTIQDFALPIGNVPIYIELHYKCESFFTVNLLAFFENQSTVEETILTIGASNEWKKIYIPINFQVSTLNASFYKISLRGNLGIDKTEAQYLFDNFKIIHLN